MGTESFLINETMQLLTDHVLTEEDIEFNLSSFDLTETPIEIALEDAETIPFLGEKKLLFLHNPYFLTAEKSKEKVEHNLSKIRGLFERTCPLFDCCFSSPL